MELLASSVYLQKAALHFFVALQLCVMINVVKSDGRINESLPKVTPLFDYS